MDYLAIADAIAAYYPALTPPAGLGAIREATGRPPTTIGMTPCVYVVLDDWNLESGNSTRAGVARFLARFYLAESADLTRDAAALGAWAGVLLDALKDHVQLDGALAYVARVVVDGLTIALLPYSGRSWAGIECRIRVTTSESWLGTS